MKNRFARPLAALSAAAVLLTLAGTNTAHAAARTVAPVVQALHDNVSVRSIAKADPAAMTRAVALGRVVKISAPQPEPEPEPTVRVHVSGRQVRLSGQGWAPHVRVHVHNTSLTSASGGDSAAPPWDGQSNGKAAEADMCDLAAAPGHRLRCDAAAAFDELAAAFAEEFGRPLRITDSYRSYAAQVNLRARKPGLAAMPGTSNHGFGLAVDLNDGLGNPGSATERWLSEHGAAFGWVSPQWAQPDGAKPEPWHWEYVGGDPRPVLVTVAADGTWSVTLGHLRGGANTLLVQAGPVEQKVKVRGS